VAVTLDDVEPRFCPRRWLGLAVSRLGRRPARRPQSKAIDVLEDAETKTLRYLYDYGDGWEHTIKV
jgi:hypothetical protein